MKKILSWLPFIAYNFLVFYLSSRSHLPIPKFPYFDKVAHFGEFFIMGVFLVWPLLNIKTRWKWVLILIIPLRGALDEFHQSFVPGRNVDFFDWVTDCFGGLVGVLVGYKIISYFLKKRVNPSNPPY